MPDVVSTGSRRSRVVPLVPVAAGAVLLLWIFAAMLTEACTTDDRCTLARCPTRCDRPEQVLIVALLLVAATAVVGVARPVPTRASLGAVALVVMVAGAVMMLLTAP